jgi:hypothetical protein
MAVESKKVAAIMGAISAYIRQESKKAPQNDKTIARTAKGKR